MTAARTPGRWRRKGPVLLMSILAAVIAFGSTTQTWLHVGLPPGAVQTPDLNVAGSAAATSVTALALVALAGALAAAIAGRIARLVICVIIMLVGAGIMAASLVIVLDPAAAAAGPIGKATGVVGGPGQISLTVFPYIGALGGLLVILAAVWMLIAGRSWAQARRFNPAGRTAPGANASGSHVPDSIAGSDGRTAGSGAGQTPAARKLTDAAQDTSAEPIDEIEGWDQLSKGQDPTG